MRSTILLCGAAGVALAATGRINPALAQASDEDSARRLGAITVTSQKREENLQDVPLSVSALTGDDLAAQQVTAVIDLSQISPSVTYTQSTNPLNSSVRIRGIGTDVFSSAVEPSVSFVVDGVVMSRQGQAFADLIDIERVEILRGPQSTLFGKNASAGVISIITEDASDEFEATAELIVAEMDEYQVRGTISGPLSDRVGGRLTGYYKEIGGHIDNVFDDRDLNGAQSMGLRGKLNIETSDAVDLTIIADYRESEDECCAWQYRSLEDPFLTNAILPVVPSEDNRQTNIDGDTVNETEQWGFSVQADWGLENHTLTSISAYREWDFDNTIDIDGTPSQGDSNALTGGLIGFDVNDGTTGLNQLSQEFRLASEFDGNVNYVVGAYYANLDLDRRFERRICLINLNTEACPATIPLSPTFAIPGAQSGFFDGTVDNTNYALFGQLDWEFADQWTLSAGARALSDSTDFTFDRPFEPLVEGDTVDPVATPDGSPDGPDNPARFGAGTVDDEALTWKFALQYAFNENVNVYGSYTRGYKGPTVDIAYESDPDPIDPETSDAFEFGLKSVLADGRIVFNAAIFNVEYEDYQAQTFSADEGNFNLENAGKISTSGVEVDFTALVTDAFTLGLSAAYTDAKIDEFPDGQCFNPAAQDPDCRANGTKDLSGGDLTNSPEWKFNANGRYDVALDSMPFDAFITGAYRWQDDVQFSITQNPNTIQESYGIFDASVGLTDKGSRYTATLFVKNLFDQSYAAFLLQDPVRTGSVNIAHYLSKNSERYFGFSLRADF
ncbi:MAG: TonB-dependent receptor [Henriciella sp.]|nr:TonB-dependent receptor [Henriciella sp.]